MFLNFYASSCSVTGVYSEHMGTKLRITKVAVLNKKLRFDENYGVNVSLNKVELLLFYLNVEKVHFLVVLADTILYRKRVKNGS
jgi:hypothetical protein